MVSIDASTKWLEVGVVPTTSTQQAIKFLRSVFATHSLPEILVSDNGSAFTSSEFETFVKRNGFRHISRVSRNKANTGLCTDEVVLTTICRLWCWDGTGI